MRIYYAHLQCRADSAGDDFVKIRAHSKTHARHRLEILGLGGEWHAYRIERIYTAKEFRECSPMWWAILKSHKPQTARG